VDFCNNDEQANGRAEVPDQNTEKTNSTPA